MRVKINIKAIDSTIAACFILYLLAFLDRSCVLRAAVFYNVDISGTSNRMVIILSVCLSTVVLSFIRLFDTIIPGLLTVYRLNRLHAYSNIMMIVLGCATGLLTYWLFIVYVVIAVTDMVYDLMYNALVRFKPNYCFKHLNRVTVRLHCYTRNNYMKCFTYKVTD